MCVATKRNLVFTFCRAPNANINGLGLFDSGSMQIGLVDLRMVSPKKGTPVSSGHGSVSSTSTLDGERFAHNRAATSNKLEVRHGAASGRGILSRASREATKGRRRRLLQEWAHGPGLTQEGFHGCFFAFCSSIAWIFVAYKRLNRQKRENFEDTVKLPDMG